VRFGATFLDEDGQEKPLVMGSYGIGPARTMAAIVEQHHDDKGIQWPASVAPYDVHVVVIPGMEEHAQSVADALSADGLEVLVDERDARAGEKFADADLIGCPVRVTVGRKVAEDGTVDVRERAKGDDKAVSVGELVSTVREILG
jgi:prolyl-tRNA synthetase